MKSIIHFFLILILSSAVCFAADRKKKGADNEDAVSLLARNIPSPGEKNILLATMLNGKDTVKIREFDVFGVNKVTTVPKMLSKAERAEKIRESVFYKQLCFEGEKGVAAKTEEYYRFLDNALTRESALYLLDYLIVPRVVTDSLIASHYQLNRKEFKGKPDQERNRIVEVLKKTKAKEIADLGRNWLDSVSTVYGIEYNQPVLKRILGFNFVSQEILGDSLSKFTQSELSSTVISCEKMNKRMLVSDLVSRIKSIPPHATAAFQNERRLKDLINGEILNHILILEADRFKLRDNPEVVKRAGKAVWPNLGILQEKILFVDGNFIPDKKEMIEYYNKNSLTDKELWCKRKMKTSEIFMNFNDADQDSTNDKIRVAIEMENMLHKIKNGADFNQFAKLHHREFSDKGSLFWIFKENHGLVGETAFNMKAGEVSEVIYHPVAMSIIKVEEVNEARPYAFEYVEEIIKNKLIQQKKETGRKKMQADLNKKYKVKFLN